MLALVRDVESYPKFLSFVSGLRIIGKPHCTPAGESFEAQMAVRYKMISETVRCRVDIDTDKHQVRVRKANTSGPIKALVNDWSFHELLDGSTLIELKVDVTLKAMPLNFLVQQKFGAASEKILQAFRARADQLYESLGSDTLDIKAEITRLGLTQTV